MNVYKSYFDRQTPFPEAKETLRSLAAEKKALPRWRWAVPAVCCAAVLLMVGVLGARLLGTDRPEVVSEPAVNAEPNPNTGNAFSESLNSSAASAPDRPADAEPGELSAPGLRIDYPTKTTDYAADIALPEGSFFVDFSTPESAPMAEDLLRSFEAMYPEYDVSARAIYDGSGDLWILYVSGVSGENDFSLELSPGHLPPSCIGRPESVTTLEDGVEVSGWSAVYGRNGEELKEYHCGSEFMAGEYGIRFENIGSPYRSAYNGAADPAMGGAMEFNARFVEWALNGGFSPDDVLHSDHIPAWRNVEFSSLEEARQEMEFAPYLPETEPVKNYDEFFGRLSYQENYQNMLFVRWSVGYSDIEAAVYLPEGQPVQAKPVDPNMPESYDVRLYGGPWADTVPEEYIGDLYCTTFRAEDMTPEIIAARGWEDDQGVMGYHFQVLCESGALVCYHCSGLTAEQMWQLVAALPELPIG